MLAVEILSTFGSFFVGLCGFLWLQYRYFVDGPKPFCPKRCALKILVLLFSVAALVASVRVYVIGVW
jgi:hypothetical protein